MPSIKEWPELERPREKLLARGAGVLSDAELLAIFLRSGIAGRSAVDLARTLLSEADGLRALLLQEQTEFCRLPGLGPAKFAELQAALELGRRFLAAQLPNREALTDPEQAKRFIHAQLKGREQEVFAALFLDSGHRIVTFEELFQGSIEGAVVYPRELVKRALAHNAAAVILAHNHPSGRAEPSDADRRITQELIAALDLIAVRVLDHLVVGDVEVVSMAERGLL